ncbi:MAG: glycosyltransferase [Elusimicrobia bacterium]|nr:glycosyltransferase [Elusimicrobiota bacterium]
MSSQPKVFHLITSTHLGGTERFLWTILKRLRGEFEFEVGYLKEHGEIGRQIQDLGIPLRWVGGNPLRLYRWLKDGRPRILHTYMYRGNLLGRLLGKGLARVPALLASQRAMDYWARFPHWRLSAALSRRWDDLLLVNSENLRGLLLKKNFPASKLRVVRGCAEFHPARATSPRETLRKAFGLPDPAYVLGSLMRLDPQKYSDRLLLLAERALSKFPDLYLLIAGDGPDRKKIESGLPRLGSHANRIRLVGWQNPATDFLRLLDAFFLLSRDEGLPNAIMEAMQSEVVCIASAVGGTPEIIQHGETGYLVADGDIEALLETVTHLRKNPSEVRCVVSQAKKLIETKFSTDIMVQKVRELYLQLLQKS